MCVWATHCENRLVVHPINGLSETKNSLSGHKPIICPLYSLRNKRNSLKQNLTGNKTQLSTITRRQWRSGLHSVTEMVYITNSYLLLIRNSSRMFSMTTAMEHSPCGFMFWYLQTHWIFQAISHNNFFDHHEMLVHLFDTQVNLKYSNCHFKTIRFTFHLNFPRTKNIYKANDSKTTRKGNKSSCFHMLSQHPDFLPCELFSHLAFQLMMLIREQVDNQRGDKVVAKGYDI